MLVSERYSYDMLRTEISAVKRLLLDGQQATDRRFDRVDSDIAVLKEDVGVLKQDVGVLKQDVGVLKQDVGVLKQDVGVLKQDVGVLKQDVGVLKQDVGVLKQDVAETKDRLGRLERSTLAGFDRMDAKFERLIGLIERDERRP